MPASPHHPDARHHHRWKVVAGLVTVAALVGSCAVRKQVGGFAQPAAVGGLASRRAARVAAVAAAPPTPKCDTPPCPAAPPPKCDDTVHPVTSIKPTFAASGTDKLPRHGYHRFYDQVLQPLYGRAVRMVEIGVLNGKSLGAWQTVFDSKRSTIYGVSWPETQAVQTKLDANVHVLFRDQSNCEHLDELAATVGAEPLDLVIDDGSHEPGHQLKTLVKLFPRVAPGGFYVIEDIETSYWDRPGMAMYGYPLLNVGVDRPGSILPPLKLLVEVLNQRYAVPQGAYDRGFHAIDAGVDPDVAWVMFAQNMVILRKKSEDDRAYEVPIDNGADGSTWKAYWDSPHVRSIIDQVAQWKC